MIDEQAASVLKGNLSARALVPFRGPLGLREGLLQQGIAIRGCGNYNGLGDGWYRIAVRPHGENEALITAIRQFCKEKALWQ